MCIKTSVVAAACLAAAGAAHAAGTVEVSFDDSVPFTDAGIARYDKEATLQTLEQHLKALGQRHLADGQTLKVEVLDIDLAGRTRWLWGPAYEVRVMKDWVDPPRISLRYSLHADGRAIRSAEETVSDFGYLNRFTSRRFDGPLPHEKQMLDRWFRERFAEPRP